MTRRSFLGCAAGAMTGCLPLAVVRPSRPRSSLIVLLDVQEYSGSRESLSGYEAALSNLETEFVAASPETWPLTLRTIGTCLDAGGIVIIESGAGFAVEASRGFRAHRALLRDSLQLDIDTPVDLWVAQPRSRRIPYVDYTWPHPAKIRDFSRVVPLRSQPRETIAWADGLPVALKRRCGRGTLIFLGSPLGPALWAGDVEARRWLLAVVTRPTLT